MKALTLTQPWASLVACGAKRVETRSWCPRRPDEIGPLAIHAAAAMPAAAVDVWEHFRLVHPLPEPLPRGAVVCVVRVLACVETALLRDRLSGAERELGDYADGRWAWRLERIYVPDAPVAARGALGLWDWTPPAGFPQFPVAPRGRAA